MKRYFSLAATVLVATITVSVAGPNDAALEAKENAAWQAFKDKKADDFKKVVGANMMAVYDEGVFDMTEQMASMGKWDMKSFAISDYKVTMSGADTAVATYVVKIEGTMDGKDASGMMNSGSVWKQEGGDWKAIFHTNVPQASTAKK
ncbi:hypothetical protein BH20VER2_BH20VER2_06730 [soil metagenome]